MNDKQEELLFQGLTHYLNKDRMLIFKQDTINFITDYMVYV